jgi:hypothetical protein
MMLTLPERPTRYALAMACVLAIALSTTAFGPARADDFHADAQHLSDASFAILNSLASDNTKAGAAQVMGAMASFAGDAQTLSSALASGDRAAAGAAMTSLVADRRAVDEALLKNPGAIDSSKWSPLKTELASIQSRMPAASNAVAKTAPPSSDTTDPHSADSHSDVADVVRPPASEASATVPDGSAPQVEITDRVTDDAGLHIKGYLQGTNLKSAGIYDGEAVIQKIDLAPVTGAQRVLLDFKLEQVSPGETIRVEDASGRAAEIRIVENSNPPVEAGGHEKMIELGGGTSVPDAPPVELASKGPVNTAEIPSKSPSRRHLHEGSSLAPLTDVQINILGVQQSISEADEYQVTGQIAGNNVGRAGIYIDGRLVKPIPVTPGGNTSFNVSFTMFGKDASIRAYGAGNNFVEASIDMSTANGAVYGSNPPAGVYAYPVNPYTRNPYGYPTTPYGAPPYGSPAYGIPPNGYPPNGYPPNGYPPPSRPWWSKVF